MTSVGGVAGDVPATPPGRDAPRGPLLRRVADVFRANEERGWRWSAGVAVLLPLVALVFAVTVLAL